VEFKDVVAALRVRWWLPVIGLVLGGLLAAGGSLLQTPLYTSSIQFFVSSTGSSSTSEAFQGGQLSEQRAASYAELLRGEQLAGLVVDRLELARTPDQLVGQLSVDAVPDTVLINVSVTDASPRVARQIADTLGAEFTRLVTRLEKPDASGEPAVQVTVTDVPEVAEAPSTPQIPRNIAIGMLAGLALAGGLALARAQLDRTVKDANEAAILAGAPVVGVVLRDDVLEKKHTTAASGASRAAEDYRQLGTNLQFLDVDAPPRVIMVSSALPSEGKSTTVANLGLALAEAGRRVVIVEADLRQPRLTDYLGLVGGVGLTNILTGSVDVEDVIQPVGDGGLAVIGAGPTPPSPGKLLSSGQMVALIEKLRAHHDFVLIDAAPLLPVADSTGLAVLVDGVLLSVHYGVTRKEHLHQAAATLERVGAHPLGVILNLVPPRAPLAMVNGRGDRYGYAVQTRPKVAVPPVRPSRPRLTRTVAARTVTD
jgi:capsular exopolysaccharide synthesis family protein